jgi:CubicO group peptidase (beta-lactamase class C family)
MTLTRLLVAGLSVLSLALVQAPPNPLPAALPASVGVQADALAKAVTLYKSAVDRDDIRGAVLYVARRGKVVLFEAIGWKHHGYRLPMTRDTLFRMASNTKPVVAAAVMMLVEDGRIALSDPAAKYLKGFDTDKSRGVTIEQLLTHSSGLRIQPILFPFAANEPPSLQAAVAKFGAEGPAAPPGTYSYNNAGYNTLGAIIEAASGLPLEQFLKTRIYDPLGMTDSLNHEDAAKLARMATVYRGRREPDGRVTFTQGFTPGDPPDFPIIRASGGLISTASDYARFLEMYRLGGVYDGRRLLKPETIKAATQGRAKIGEDSAYGYGWMVRTDGTYSHAGSDGTMAWIDPKREIIAMVFTQSPGGNNPTAEFRKLVELAVDASSIDRR